MTVPKTTETTALEDFHYEQHLKWIVHITRRGNNYIIKMQTLHVNSDK